MICTNFNTLSVNPWRMLRHCCCFLDIGWSWKRNSGWIHGWACRVWTILPSLFDSKMRQRWITIILKLFPSLTYAQTALTYSESSLSWASTWRPMAVSILIEWFCHTFTDLWSDSMITHTANDVQGATSHIGEYVNSMLTFWRHILVHFRQFPY